MPSMKNTAALVHQLRALMQDTKYVTEPLSAYLIPSFDAHSSEYIAPCDMRRAFISGFTGSAGLAAVTLKEACLWTDGRYYLQASQEMDSTWTLMKEGLPSTPTLGDWLETHLPPGSKVGVDPKVYPEKQWTALESQLASAQLELVPVPTNLVNFIWKNRPPRPNNPLKTHPLTYSGETITSKLERIRKEMFENNCSVLLLVHLDEIAWTLNLRGSDIEFNPVFFSYVVIDCNSITLCIDKEKVTSDVLDHFKEELNEKCRIEPYENVIEVFQLAMKDLQGSVWLSENTNHGLVSLVPKKYRFIKFTPPCRMKTVKNPVEIKGMKNAHVKDAVALCSYFSWLEKHIACSSSWITEFEGACRCDGFRAEQDDFVGPSFATISATGPNGAIIHYRPDQETSSRITKNELYLCDSGGQYKDGTTDITRTLHFGTPSAYEKECFTRVLKGQIALATATFPAGINGMALDGFARRALWDAGSNYPHGTGHGIGAFLNVHEGPIGIAPRDAMPLQAGMTLSNEPGYYVEGKFGIRLEDVVLTVKSDLGKSGQEFLTFENISLVPKQIKMIARELLSDEEISFLNWYHLRCRSVVGAELEKQGKREVKQWLWKETEPIKLKKFD